MPRTANEQQDDTDLRVAVGVIQSQMVDMKAQNGQQFNEIKKSLTDAIKKIDGLSYVHETRYAKDRDEDKKTYATKEELKSVKEDIKPIKNMFYAILTAIVLLLITAVITFALKGGLK